MANLRAAISQVGGSVRFCVRARRFCRPIAGGARLNCAEAVRLTPEEYERVRGNPRRFVVFAGHEAPGAEVVVERHPGYLLVEKVGDAASVAEELDPRS